MPDDLSLGPIASFQETRVWQTGDLLLRARVHALAAAGRIEPRGGDPRQGLAAVEIRLPGRGPVP